MASPIAHALAGYLISRVIPYARQQEGWTMAGLCSFLAVSPDLDFLPGLLQGQPALYHQGISHSLGSAVLVSSLAALLLFRGFRHVADTSGSLLLTVLSSPYKEFGIEIAIGNTYMLLTFNAFRSFLPPGLPHSPFGYLNFALNKVIVTNQGPEFFRFSSQLVWNF